MSICCEPNLELRRSARNRNGGTIAARSRRLPAGPRSRHVPGQSGSRGSISGAVKPAPVSMVHGIGVRPPSPRPSAWRIVRCRGSRRSTTATTCRQAPPRSPDHLAQRCRLERRGGEREVERDMQLLASAAIASVIVAGRAPMFRSSTCVAARCVGDPSSSSKHVGHLRSVHTEDLGRSAGAEGPVPCGAAIGSPRMSRPFTISHVTRCGIPLRPC